MGIGKFLVVVNVTMGKYHLQCEAILACLLQAYAVVIQIGGFE